MATKTLYARLTVHREGDDLIAQIVTDTASHSRTLKPGRYFRPGWRLEQALRFAYANGWSCAEGSNWFLHEGADTRRLERVVELCPNGQDPDECSEIDPCESCWQDQQDEGDVIEESMGLRHIHAGCGLDCDR